MAFDAKLRIGDWVRHTDGRVGAVQSYGFLNVWSMRRNKSSRARALRSGLPYVLVDVNGMDAWWSYREIACCVAAPLLGDRRA